MLMFDDFRACITQSRNAKTVKKAVYDYARYIGLAYVSFSSAIIMVS